MTELLVRDVCKAYPTRGEPLEILRGCSLSLARGEAVAVLGPSGSGKSTLLHVLGGLEAPTSGTVELCGENPYTLAPQALAAFRNRRIGFVFQDHHLLPQCSVLENVLVPALAGGSATAEHVARAGELINRVGLAARTDHRPAELSGGERQRVAIARALLLRPTLLLADEPTGNLDRTTAASVSQLFLELQQQEQMIAVVVTHSLELAALMPRRLELDAGRLREASPVLERDVP
ncbi:MAG: ABC transporter ATP-binding protein [Pirellulales bacterium]|nr:ABC transporter ATP-binding protein [Pirellulales bacterium]